ncbi:hypothetical protein PHLCEN_2v1527 [Hermanssonia centrifuga]|uniref:Enoyl reductase (ER) domain-containing protein n=1 Tax=Hermanssonia centrifuga TaxID=98765 RepID=A0A2R6RZP1_9APHY|nr:hypothetical protein PHLCEN_2v1527 [Hermanssonia centrifuga]
MSSSTSSRHGLLASQTQRAWINVAKGNPADVLVIDEKRPIPTQLADGEVLIKVQAAALNPVPLVPELDYSGIVVDSNGTHLKDGQAVFGMIPGPPIALRSAPLTGTLAQYIRVPATCAIPRPTNIKATEAAGVGACGTTAYQALFSLAKLEPGQHVFVNGGSTSVGIFAIQLAKAIGCRVTATASGKNGDFLKSIGVDKFVDYTLGPLDQQLVKDLPSPKFHVMLEAVGNLDIDLFTQSESYLAPGGTFVTVGPQPEGFGLNDMFALGRYGWGVAKPAWLCGASRTWRMLRVEYNQEDLAAVAQYISEGKIKPIVDSVYDFDDALKAYERIMTKRAVGKVVVKIDPEAD